MDHPLPEPYVLGVDESGRGPVLGHMVYCTCACPASKKGDLANLGFDDSKALTAQQRERMFSQIKEVPFLEYTLDPISPLVISSSMLRRTKVSLNELAHNSTIALIQAWLDKGYNVQEVYIDTVGIAEHYQAKLKRQFPSIGTIVVAKKADSIYPVVSAASICAKVTRDLMLRDWKLNMKKSVEIPEQTEVGEIKMEEPTEEEDSNPRRSLRKRKVVGESSEEQADDACQTASGKRVKLTDQKKTYTLEFGSGYPSDPSTKRWLVDSIDPVFGFPDMVRHSWKTAAVLVDANCAQVDWGDQDDGKKKGKQGKLIFDAEPSADGIKQTARHSYFRGSHLHLVPSFDQ